MQPTYARGLAPPRPNVALSIPDKELVRHEDIAYEDGYADATGWGEDGFFISSRYGEEARTRYLQGFKLGLRVYALTQTGGRC